MITFEDRQVFALVSGDNQVLEWYFVKQYAELRRDTGLPGARIVPLTVRATIEHSGAEAGRVSYAVPTTI